MGQSQKVLGKRNAFLWRGEVVRGGTGCQARAGLGSRGRGTNSGPWVLSKICAIKLRYVFFFLVLNSRGLMFSIRLVLKVGSES